MDQGSDKMDKLASTNLAIDGARIRTVRETKKLTQLYVANVVGVTTDTISRWENNRYPSIKRENAEKLASALEVDLEEILRLDDEIADSIAEPALPAVLSARLLLWSGTVFLGVLLLALVLFMRRPETAPTAVRWIPRFAAPGEIIPVQIKIHRRPGENVGFILKEKLPAGFRLVSASPASSGDSTGSGIKWLIPDGSTPVTVFYTVMVPAAHPLRKEDKLAGEIILHAEGANRTEQVVGNDSITIGTYHWADSNGDGRIDDDEIMPAYYICEDMKGLGLDWKIIESIWSGKGYNWSQQGGFTVLQ